MKRQRYMHLLLCILTFFDYQARALGRLYRWTMRDSLNQGNVSVSSRGASNSG